MKLLTKDIHERLVKNGQIRRAFEEDGQVSPDFIPVVKLFMPDGPGTWILTELDAEDPDIAYGLCDLGMGFPETGPVRISEIMAVRGSLGLPVERDKFFIPMTTLSAYARAAYAARGITEDRQDLEQAASKEGAS